MSTGSSGPLLLAVTTALASCTTVIHPSAHVVDPVQVFVLDHGRHSALVLPTADGGAMQWAWGEWQWYALDRTQWWRTPAVVFWPTRATLGRAPVAEPLGAPLSAASLARRLYAEEVHVVVVERAAALALEAELEARFAAGAEEEVYSSLYRLSFVPDDERSYWIVHHCNSETKDWLRALGCEVSGAALFADFTVRKHSDE
jgi:hypothetical protein